MSFFKIFEEDYLMVFIVNRIFVFRFVVEFYLFLKWKLLMVYDYESEVVDEINRVLEKCGVKVVVVEFLWLGLRICLFKLRKMVIVGKSGSIKKKKKKGVFVFLFYFRVIGLRYFYLWMSVV